MGLCQKFSTSVVDIQPRLDGKIMTQTPDLEQLSIRLQAIDIIHKWTSDKASGSYKQAIPKQPLLLKAALSTYPPIKQVKNVGSK